MHGARRGCVCVLENEGGIKECVPVRPCIFQNDSSAQVAPASRAEAFASKGYL